MPEELRNHELVTLAVYLVGGDAHEVDTEDVAIKADELAPGRFTWRKYRDQINIEIIRAFLSDAKKPKNGGYLIGTGNTGWLLTGAGLSFVTANLIRLKTIHDRGARLGAEERRRRTREHDRLLSTAAFQKYSAGEQSAISMRDAEAAFRLNEYIVGEARRRKVQKLVNTFADDEELGGAIRFLAALACGETGDD